LKAIFHGAMLAGLLGVAGAAAAQTPQAEDKPAAGTRATEPSRTARRTERLELETTTITGNRELPKVMYVVPWKHPEAGDLRGKPMESLVDEALAPVDREVFNREISYFRALQAPRDAGVETPVTASQAAP